MDLPNCARQLYHVHYESEDILWRTEWLQVGQKIFYYKV
jgi:hypothetical protein